MHLLLVFTSLIGFCAPQAVHSAFQQNCPNDQPHICPTTDGESNCNVRSDFRTAYAQVTLGTETQLFMNCVPESDPGYDASLCVAPSPNGKIVFVDATFNKQPALSETIEGLYIQYLEATFNFVDFGYKNKLQVDYRINQDAHRTATIDPNSLVDTTTCDGTPMTAGTFHVYVPISFKAGGADREVKDIVVLHLNIRDSAVPEWAYSFVGLDKTSSVLTFSIPERSDLVKEAGTFLNMDTPQIVNTILAPTPSPTDPTPILNEEGIIGVSAAGGLLLIGALMFLYLIKVKKRSFNVRSLSQNKEPKSKESIRKISNPRQDKTRNSSAFVTESPLFDATSSTEINKKKNKINKPPGRGSVVARSLRAAPTPWRSASTNKSSTDVMNSTQRNELLAFLRPKETKLSERELMLKVAKLSRYQRTDLIRALNTIYHAVPKSLEADRASLGLTSDDAAAAIAPSPGLPPPGPPPDSSSPPPPPPPLAAQSNSGRAAPMPSTAFGTPTIQED